MKSLQGIFFWFGGVLVPALPETVVREACGKPFASASPQTRTALRKLAGTLAMGQVGGARFCREALEICRSEMNPEDLPARILEGCRLQLSMEDYIDRLPEGIQRWLVVDFPRDWFTPLAGRLDLSSRFPKERILFTSDFGLSRFVPDVFYHILQRANLPMEDCMIVDALVPRAVEAVRHGFSSTIYVDDRRLERDYKLRKLFA